MPTFLQTIGNPGTVTASNHVALDPRSRERAADTVRSTASTMEHAHCGSFQ
jgi:hypothetical protein